MTAVTLRPPSAESSDRIPQDPDALDLELDDVARLQPAPVSLLEDATGADRSRAEHVARQEARVARRVRDDRAPRVVHVPELAARALLAVDAREHRAAAAVELVGRDDDRPEAGREVLPLRRPEADPHLRALQISRGPVVHDREAADLAPGADDRSHLELVVELVRVRRLGDLVALAVDRRGAREVEDVDLVPLVRHVEAARRTRRLDVLLESVEVPHRRRVQHPRARNSVAAGAVPT